MSTYNTYMALSGAIAGEVLQNEKLAKHTSFHVGGAADLFVRVDDYPSLVKVLDVLSRHGLAYTVLGKGSNVLVADAGYKGAVIMLGKDFSRIDVSSGDNSICVGGAAPLPKLVSAASAANLSGLEFCAGIPGSLGGAVRMNAGTRDTWLDSIVRDVLVWRPYEGMHRYLLSDLNWSYREVSIPPEEIILEATLNLIPAPHSVISRNLERLSSKRRHTQPLGKPSCGSVFRNPEGGSAGRLIEECGLKGTRQGGAQISEVHANFIINTGGATAEDIYSLIDLMHTRVLETHGIDLKREVRFIGYAGRK